MRAVRLLFLIVLSPMRTFAAGDAGQPGEFLRQEPTARGAALGGALGAAVDDASALVWNPAGLARLAKPEVGATHIVLFEDTTWDFIAGAMPSKRFGTFSLGLIRQTSGGFERRAGPNDPAVGFSVTQQALLFGAGKTFGPVDLGLTVKSVKETIDTASGSGAGADAGVIWRARPGVRVGLAARNILQPAVTLVSSEQRYARTYDLSPSFVRSLSKDLSLMATMRLTKTDGESVTAGGGVELRYRALAAARIGYQSKGLTSGVGARFGNTSFDYATLVHELGLSHIITFTQRFGQTREELEETIRRGIGELTREDGARLAKAYVQRAEREMQEDRLSEALHDFESASLLDPANQEIHDKIQKVGERWEAQMRHQLVDRTAQLAEREEASGNTLAARQYWRSVIELDPTHAKARERTAAIDSELSTGERSRLDAARKAREEADAGQTLVAAQSLAERGAYRQALTELEHASLKLPDSLILKDALPEYREKLRAFVAGRVAEGDRLAGGRDFAGALRAIEPALREAPGDHSLAQKAASWRAQMSRTASPEDRKKAEQLYYQAVEQYLKGDFKSADALSKEVLSLDPGSEAALALKEKVDAALRYQK